MQLQTYATASADP